ncbi:hypothetical protein LNP74_25995 [Klebsiella pneumoniae subsp. pneumoniae]|nr:hypothetical protein [Klebsiella pneumoniae subsp. pneumoniae]
MLFVASGSPPPFTLRWQGYLYDTIGLRQHLSDSPAASPGSSPLISIFTLQDKREPKKTGTTPLRSH